MVIEQNRQHPRGDNNSEYNPQSAGNRPYSKSLQPAGLSPLLMGQSVSTEAQATTNLTEGVEMPAGLVRPGSSPAASLTADWQRRVLVSAAGWVPAPGYWVPVAELQPGGGMSDIPTDHTQSNANPVVPVATQHPVHEADYDSRTVHICSNQCSAASVAVLAHSAAELVAVDYHRQ